MISVDRALQIVLDNTRILDKIEVSALDSLGMVLADEIVSKEDIPPYDTVMIDGYALRSADVTRCGQTAPVVLELDGEAKVGTIWKDTIQAGHAVKVPVGSAMPEGADTIVSSEHAVRDSSSKVKIYKTERPGEGIFLKGSDIVTGSPVLNEGRVLTVADIGVLGAIGQSVVSCYRKPKVSFFAYGNDLISPEDPFTTGKIRASNCMALQCQLNEYGAAPVNLGIIGSDTNLLKQKVEKAIESDMFIASVGSSLDDFDSVKSILQRLGMDLKFWKVAIKPGKPVIFGTINGLPVFGLSNNHLSSMVVLEQFIKPAIHKMQGKRDFRRTEVIARLDKDIKGGGGLTYFVRAEVKVTDDGFLAIPAGSKTSQSVRAFCSANGFIIVPQQVSQINAGEMVKVMIVSDLSSLG